MPAPSINHAQGRASSSTGLRPPPYRQGRGVQCMQACQEGLVEQNGSMAIGLEVPGRHDATMQRAHGYVQSQRATHITRAWVT
jgi:hypothetical protein